MSANVFLSHSTEDKAFVRRLARDLRRFGAAVWVDEAEIRLGDTLLDKIKGGLQNVEHLGVILSPRSVASEWVTREIKLTKNLARDGRRLKILPILIEECKLPRFLKGIRYADFRDPSDYQRQMRYVAGEIGLDLPMERTASGQIWMWLQKAEKTSNERSLRNALYAFLTSPGAADRNVVNDVLGGSDSWSAEMREVAAREFLAAIDYPGSQGLAAVQCLKEWGRSNQGQPAPTAMVEALTSGDPLQRIAARLYFNFSGDPTGVGDEDAQVLLPKRDQPVHLRIASAHFSAWNVLNPVLEGIGSEPRDLQEELMEILEAPAES